MSIVAVTFTAEATGRVQLARTGSGFYRWDHGESFAIDHDKLALLLRNTQLRKRPLRMDFMHYANGTDGMPVDALGAAGCIEPTDITLESWTEPNTGASGFGLFAPSSWTDAGRAAVEDGIDEISPVIDWAYELPEDVIDPETGETILAGTEVGPCITGVSLVDRGFFWMDKVKLYSEVGAKPHASLYQETAMALPLDKLQALIKALMAAGFTDEEAQVVIEGAMKGTVKAEPEEVPEMPAAEPAPAVPAVLAARVPAPKPAKPSTLAELWQQAKAAKPSTSTPTGTQNYGERFVSMEERLSRLEASHDELMISDLERQGLLVGISDPRKLYKEAPAYFMEQVAKNTPLTTASPGPASRPTGLRNIVKNIGMSDEDKFALEVKSYREGQAKAGRPISQQVAIEEVEAAQKQAAKR